MQCVLAQLSLDNWNPLTVILTVCVSCYTLAQCTVMIIRAMRGDNTPTALEGQIAQLAAAHRTNATALNDLQRDFVPPEAVTTMIQGTVREYLATLRKPVANPTPTATATQTTTITTPVADPTPPG